MIIGGIYIASFPNPFEKECPRSIIVLSTVNFDGIFVSGCMVTNEPELATEKDLKLPMGTVEDWPGCELVVETDIAVHVMPSQLGNRLGTVSERDFDTIRKMLCFGSGAELSPQERLRTGLPCIYKDEPRWKWKTDEVSVAHRISSAVWKKLLEGEQGEGQ